MFFRTCECTCKLCIICMQLIEISLCTFIQLHENTNGFEIVIKFGEKIQFWKIRINSILKIIILFT